MANSIAVVIVLPRQEGKSTLKFTVTVTRVTEQCCRLLLSFDQIPRQLFQRLRSFTETIQLRKRRAHQRIRLALGLLNPEQSRISRLLCGRVFACRFPKLL